MTEKCPVCYGEGVEPYYLQGFESTMCQKVNKICLNCDGHGYLRVSDMINTKQINAMDTTALNFILPILGMK